MLRDIRLTLFVSPHAKGRDAYFLRFQGWGLTTRKIDSCTFVANDTLGPKGREAYFLGAHAERIAKLTCTLSIDQWHEQQFGDMLVVGEHKREESNFFGAYRLKDGTQTLGANFLNTKINYVNTN